jgi:DNA-binding GntR family transcriptional regulator
MTDAAADSLSTPISRNQSLRTLVHERVRGALMRGEIAPGERFTESQLAEGLGTSRAPIREALRQLEQEGLIVPSGQRGYVLRPMQVEDVRELGLLRLALERLAAGLAVERADAGEIAGLEPIIERMHDAEQASPNEAQAELDAEFHEALCRLSKHKALVRTWLSMRDQLTLAMRTVNLAWKPVPGFAESHQRVLDALRAGDPEVAERTIEQHIRAGLEQLVSVTSAGGSATPDPAG